MQTKDLENQLISPSFWSSVSKNSVATLQFANNITTVFLNIGSNLDPILPPLDYGDTAVTIAFEPIVGCQINTHQHLLVVNAAVAAMSGLTSMNVYNDHGLSSSLSKPVGASFWNSNPQRGDGDIQLVPVLTVPQILNAIPSHISIPYIKTDMQGHDFGALKDSIELILERHVDFLYSEVYFGNQPTYERTQNDFCLDWWPHMQRQRGDQRYELQHVELPFGHRLNATGAQQYCQREIAQSNISRNPSSKGADFFLSEGNALWKRSGAKHREFRFQFLENHETLVPTPQSKNHVGD